MSENVSMEEFLEVEKKYNLYAKEADGVNYWNYARFVLWHNIILKNKLALEQAHNGAGKKLKVQVKNLAQMLFRCVYRDHRLYKQVDVCFINHPRKVLVDDYYTCLYTDEIKELFVNSVTLEFPYQGTHYKPSKDEKIIYMDYLFVTRGIYTRIFKGLAKKQCNRLYDTIKGQIRVPLQEIEKKYSLKLKEQEIVDLMLDYVIYYKASYKKIEKLLKKLRPKVLVEVVGYDHDCMMFNEASRKLGITTVELQHGNMADHCAYNYRTEKTVKQLPEKIFLFSDFWKEYMRMPINSKDVITTGFPFFEKKMKETPKIPKYDDGKTNILFVSQGPIGKKLSRVAVELSQLLDKEKYRIFYKLHPGEYTVWREKYDELSKTNIIVLDSNKSNIYDYFATCHVQIGVYSTALYEGLGFGLLTYVLKVEMSERMERLCNAGYAEYFQDAMSLKNKIEQSITECDKEKESGKFWKVNALNNMVDNIENVLHNGEK